MEQDRLIIRLPAELKMAFENACKQKDRTVSQIVRDLIRGYVRDNAQLELEETSTPRRAKK